MAFSVSLFTVRPGGAAASPLQALLLDYLRRCSRVFEAEARTFRTEAALLTEAAADRQKSSSALWIADLGGISMTTDQFAGRIRQARDGGLRHLVLAVGPADGWSLTARTAAELRLSLGPMTLPHELAALVLAEQIYRVSTILQGHPYHLGH